MRSGVGQLKEFSRSGIWLDILDELGIWLNQIHEQLENHGMECDHRMLDRLGGCAEAVRNFSDIVNVLTDLAEGSKGERDTLLKNLIKGR